MAIIPAEEKVFMVSNSTNTTYSGSAALKAMQQWYTMDDVTNTVRPYKVYTALLTQSGGSSSAFITSGTLTIGVTYCIVDPVPGDDFTNVGAPNNNNGTYFVATGATPNNWTNGTELDYNPGAPVATVLENTIGNVWFIYNDVGSYFFNSNGVFTENNTIGFITFNDCCDFGLSDKPILAINANYTINNIAISSALDGIYSNSVIQNTPIEIRVYS